MVRETTATGKWTKRGVPHKGWSCIDVETREEKDHLCEMCEARYVKFVHIMEHLNYDGPLHVGCICAGYMEDDPVGAREREATFKSSRSRRARWLSRDWRLSTAGNHFVNTSDGFNIVVFRKRLIWGARVEHRASGYRSSTLPYDTEDQAKLAAFDVMIGMKHRRPWKKARVT